MAVRLGRSPSQLLLPLAFAAHAGSLLVLTGTPVNVIVSEAADEAGVGSFKYFEFALVGVPLLLGTIAIVVLLGERLLPIRTAKTLPADFSNHARTLVDQYELEQDAATLLTRKHGVAEVVIPPRSSAIGEAVSPGMVTDSGDLVILAVRRNGEDQGPGESVLAVGDTLLLRGKWDALDENLEDPAVLVVDAPALVRRQAVPLGPGAKRVLVDPRGHGRAPRHGCGAARGGGAARRGCDRADERPHGRAVLPRDLVDDGDPGRRDDPALDGDARDRRGRQARRRARADRRAAPAATRFSSASSSSPPRSGN